MEEIYTNGPVQVIFKVYEDFFMYKSGIYSRHPRANVLNIEDPYHSVKVIGWGTENNVDYWVGIIFHTLYNILTLILLYLLLMNILF